MKMKMETWIQQEQIRQNSVIELIASENFVSQRIRDAVGSCLTNKYAEGYPAVNRTGNNSGRYYGGCEYIDKIEDYCCRKWQQVFRTNYHVNVQPHSGSNANLAAYMAVLRRGDKVLAMELQNGGHLTHGSPANFSGKLFSFYFYGVDKNGFIDYNDVRNQALTLKPKLIVAGASAYSREIDFKRFRDIADEVGALLMVDMSHIAGLVAAGCHNSPFVAGADIVTTTTHKTLRGPRGALIFCKPQFATKIDSAVFPGVQGGPLEHVIAGKAICAEEALTEDYYEYIHHVVANAKTFANCFKNMGYKVVTGGTDTHLFLLDLSPLGLTGKAVQEALDAEGITVNKNCIPGETRGPSLTSGIRLGTPAMTTRGWREDDFALCAARIDEILKGIPR